MPKTVAGSLLLSLMLILPLFAQQPGPGAIEVERAVVATAIENREPVGVADSFPEDVGSVYYHTTLTGEFGETTLEHVWLHDGQEMARVALHVRGPRWRTWSAKKIPPPWSGPWEVRLVDGGGAVLHSTRFNVGSE